MSSLRVLLVGSGAREHALGVALTKSEAQLYVAAPTVNPGLKRIARGYKILGAEGTSSIASWGREVRAGLALVGPEAPLASGVADRLRSVGIPTVGPGASAARVESSKAFARELMEKHGIPGLIRYQKVSRPEDLELALHSIGEPLVVKPSWLTAGKGVWVQGEDFLTSQEAAEYAGMLLGEGKRAPVLVEEKLDGEEFSLMAFVDGSSVYPMPAVRDYKRALEGDKGGNTGGMGSYSTRDHLLPFLSEEDYREGVRILEKTVTALKEEGLEYRGILYGGFMLTAAGPRILEFNARFGDPEALNVLTLFDGTNFTDLLLGVAEGSVNPVHMRFRQRATVVRYLVPPGYGSHPEAGGVLEVDETEIEKLGVTIYYGSAVPGKRPGEVVMGSSRALALVGEGSALRDALVRVGQATDFVKGNYRFRSDVASALDVKRQVDHVRTMRGLPLTMDPLKNPTRCGPTPPSIFT